MKVVLFCGGLGMRLREYSENIPKPMVPIGYRPILWHVMKYYAHFGHKDFILCLGYRGDSIKNYFLKYDECLSNDFVLSRGGKNVELFHTDTHDWNITFADTGMSANIGQRLKAAEKYLEGEEVFFANYTDGLSDVSLPDQLAHFCKHDKIASFASVRPKLSYHLVTSNPVNDVVSDIQDMSQSDVRMNGGYFIFKRDIFRFMRNDEELVCQPFQRLIREQQLLAYNHDGFWASMDTFKDKQQFDELYSRGNPPWEVWGNSPSRQGTPLEPAGGTAASPVSGSLGNA